MTAFTPPSLAAFRSGAVRFTRWWLAELGDMIPASLRLRAVDERPACRLAISQRGLMLMAGDGPALKIAGLVARDGQWIIESEEPPEGLLVSPHSLAVIELGPDLVLRREVALPRLTPDEAQSALALQLPELLPLESNRLVWTAVPVSEGGFVRLYAAHRSLVDQATDFARGMGLEPVGVHATVPDNADPTELRPDLLHRLRAAPRRLALVLASMSLVMLFLAYGIALHRLNRADEDLTLSLASAEAAGRELNTRRARLADFEARFAAISEIVAMPSLGGVLNELSRVLPDNAWVTDFQMHGIELRMSGTAADTAPIIATLEASTFFRDVQLISITPSSEGAGNRFEMVMTIEHAVAP